MKAKDQWFAVFGADGAPFVKTIINSILGLILVTVLVIFTTRIVSLIIQGKSTDDEDKLSSLKVKTRRSIIGFLLAATSTALMIMVINIIPRPAGTISNKSWFDTFGDSKGEVKKVVNWLMAVLTAIGIIVFLITTPIKVIKWMLTDEDDKGLKRKAIIRNIIMVVALLTITLTVTVIANVIPPISAI